MIDVISAADSGIRFINTDNENQKRIQVIQNDVLRQQLTFANGSLIYNAWNENGVQTKQAVLA